MKTKTLLLITLFIITTLQLYPQLAMNPYIHQQTLIDPIITPDLVSLWNKNSIDAAAIIEGDDITIWNDDYGSNNATQTGTARPKLHIASNGDRQARFDGVDDWLNVGTPSDLNFISNTNAFSCVVKVGESTPIDGYYFSKASSSSSLRNYGFFDSNSTSGISAVLGGQSNFSGVDSANNDLIIWTVAANGDFVIRRNGTEIDSGNVSGTGNSDVDINIGSRSNGGFLLDGDVEMIAMYNDVLTAQEISDIESEHIE